ncbi:hypothetical protein NP233_g11850 [Leucocoprinus birnbaumii]|uniref:Uncharacterized protein n=1 Tax=Leucocoprinus birnbaumii TaxID=56174 RepID=A0AAD5VLF1_9AGAR|nr:hypothetical protein NP233_g11850 [Leucocoprinus birnbaumii]
MISQATAISPVWLIATVMMAIHAPDEDSNHQARSSDWLHMYIGTNKGSSGTANHIGQDRVNSDARVDIDFSCILALQNCIIQDVRGPQSLVSTSWEHIIHCQNVEYNARLTMQWGVAKCCSIVGFGRCIKLIAGIFQVSVQWFSFTFIFFLYMKIYPECLKYIELNIEVPTHDDSHIIKTPIQSSKWCFSILCARITLAHFISVL